VNETPDLNRIRDLLQRAETTVPYYDCTPTGNYARELLVQRIPALLDAIERLNIQNGDLRRALLPLAEERLLRSLRGIIDFAGLTLSDAERAREVLGSPPPDDFLPEDKR
jgi:hypothetical protein